MSRASPFQTTRRQRHGVAGSIRVCQATRTLALDEDLRISNFAVLWVTTRSVLITKTVDLIRLGVRDSIS